jgi:hypothetical protein
MTLDEPASVTFDLTPLVRIVIGTVFGFAMGWERGIRGSEAGDRTFASGAPEPPGPAPPASAAIG